jgi:hypothetical protein
VNVFGPVGRRLVGSAIGVAMLPHELAHAAAIRPWTAEVRIDLDPTRDARFAGRRGGDRPLARFDAAVPATTPRWAIRLCAIAPLPTLLAVAVVVDAAVGFAGVSPLTVAATVAVAAWASPSGGDLAVLAAPDDVIEAGAFVVDGAPRWADPVATLLAVGTTVAVAAIIVG